MVWVGRDLKYHLVPTPLTWARTPSTSPGYSKPHPTLRVTEPWPRLPREAAESPSLEIFQPRLDKILCPLLWVTLLRQGGWTR